MCHFQENVTRHQISSSCSPEPPQPTSRSTHTPEHPDSVTEDTEDVFGCSETNTNDLEDFGDAYTITHPQEKSAKRDTVIKDKNEVPQIKNIMENGHELQDKDDDDQGDPHAEEHTVTLRWVIKSSVRITSGFQSQEFVFVMLAYGKMIK